MSPAPVLHIARHSRQELRNLHRILFLPSRPGLELKSYQFSSLVLEFSLFKIVSHFSINLECKAIVKFSLSLKNRKEQKILCIV